MDGISLVDCTICVRVDCDLLPYEGVNHQASKKINKQLTCVDHE